MTSGRNLKFQSDHLNIIYPYMVVVNQHNSKQLFSKRRTFSDYLLIPEFDGAWGNFY